MSVNFNSSLPAPVPGTSVVTFQTDGSGNISAYTSGSPLASVVNLTAQAAAISTTTLLAVTSAGLYRLSYYANITTAGNAVNLTATFGWTDDSGVAATVTSASIPCNTLGNNSVTSLGLGSIEFYADTSTNITYATALSGAIGVGQYALRLRLENLG